MSFIEQLKKNFQDGLLLLVKYGLLIVTIVYAFSFMQDTRNKANNGEQAALFIVELQKKGYLPQLVNGSVPEKVASSVDKK